MNDKKGQVQSRDLEKVAVSPDWPTAVHVRMLHIMIYDKPASINIANRHAQDSGECWEGV